jgi:protein SCO1/2
LNTNIRNTVLLCLVFVVIVTVAFVHNVLREPVLTEQQLRDQGTFILPTPRELDLEGLVDQNGEPFTNARLQGRWTFLFFGFTSCPDICPVALSVLSQVERELEVQGDRTLHDAFAGVLVTVDPERDDATTLGRYVASFSPRFIGVRGEPAAIAEFARQVNAAFMKVPDGDGYTVDHTGNIVVINPKGHYHAFIKLPHDRDKVLLAYKSIVSEF